MYRTVNVDVEVDLYDFDTEELIEELENRDVPLSTQTKALVQTIYDKRMLKKDYQKDLDELVWEVLGRIS
jgi:hypothetical protein|tara:strand:+ start:2649 stop:2858 length:210 start_codon:yes stop_codon:yes gene_type:complete